MSMFDTSDLHKRVERYESALDEMRAAQQDCKNVLHDQVLYERWQQLGAELGFVVVPTPNGGHPGALSGDGSGHQMPQLTDAWAG
jgi:hypothetical protein